MEYASNDHTEYRIDNRDTLNGVIVFKPDVNEIVIIDKNNKPTTIHIVVDDDLNPIGLAVNNNKLLSIKEITENERGNLDDSSVHYGTGPDSLQQLI